MNNSIIAQTQVQLDTLVNSIVTLINNTLAPMRLVNEDAEPGDHDYNVWEAVPIEDRPFGQDGSQYFMPIFVRRGEEYRGDRYTGVMPGEDVYALTGHHWRDSLFTMGNFIVNPLLRSQAGYKYMTLSISGDAEDQTLLAELLRGWDSRRVAVDGAEPLSVEEFYNRMVGSMAIEVNRFRTASEAENDVLVVTENARLSMKGVALDEEMANMLRFQHAFHGASRIFNYVDSMIDTLINRTGRVGL
jgi:flagellar hook-associated protein 1 FlgK